MQIWDEISNLKIWFRIIWKLAVASVADSRMQLFSFQDETCILKKAKWPQISFSPDYENVTRKVVLPLIKLVVWVKQRISVRGCPFLFGAVLCFPCFYWKSNLNVFSLIGVYPLLWWFLMHNFYFSIYI